MYGTIYCITNAVNGKKYVGQTTLSIEARWQLHLKSVKYASAGALHCAIRKYGIESFKIDQVDFAESLEELNNKEIHYIAQLGTMAPNGYNLTSGGEALSISDETHRKLSEAALGRATVSIETRRKLSESLRGHPVSKKTRQKISESAKTMTSETRERISEAAIKREAAKRSKE